MNLHPDKPDAAAHFIEVRPGMRKALADAVEAFLALLDQIDADVDLEDDALEWSICPGELEFDEGEGR